MPIDEEMSITESFTLFKQLLIEHAVHRPPFSTEIFNTQDAQLISNYLFNTYYKHYKMYQYVCKKKQIAHVKTYPAQSLVQIPVPCKALKDAMTEEAYKKMLASQQQPTAVEEAVPTNVEQQKDSDEQQVHTPVKTTPKINPYLEKQLEDIKQSLMQMTNDKLSDLQGKVAELEQAIADMNATRPKSETKKKK